MTPGSGSRATILALGGLVLLLLGVVAGQNLERWRSAGARPASQPVLGAAGDGVSVAGGRNPERSTAAPLSTTEYWITPPEVDATRTGHSAWAVLRPGGSFILERCRAPEYVVPEDRRAPVPDAIAQCETVVDGAISRLGDAEIVVERRAGPPMAFRYSLGRDGTAERLTLEAGSTVKLVPGSKNALFERLHRLPGDEQARSRYTRRLYGASPN